MLTICLKNTGIWNHVKRYDFLHLNYSNKAFFPLFHVSKFMPVFMYIMRQKLFQPDSDHFDVNGR